MTQLSRFTNDNCNESHASSARYTFKKAFEIGGEEAERILSSLNRMYVRLFEDAPPFEMEYPVDIDMQMLSEFLGNPVNFNEATGLPISLDMVARALLL